MALCLRVAWFLCSLQSLLGEQLAGDNAWHTAFVDFGLNKVELRLDGNDAVKGNLTAAHRRAFI